ncbi:DsbA family protein [Stenotrophomonas sp. SAU14A_NAIMI4_8]|uniref:DsbA family oxidoreductase n=1 Tax=Stenotrophomonas sp. SAU14A_NAIMI4_8 TaxID=2072409 RepID=UPI000D53EFF5|nr:DsbA family protein [Stenotrophomonas sp. SAU14A_NAIMI4_8]AWH33472.1 DsbA family protein [Stenotrophomonas sp. SAU14A_NAIMI4_8]
MSSAPSPTTATPVVDFFHDVVCGWCFVLAPRLQQVSAELGIQVRHRSFVLQDSRARMIDVFGSMPRAKDTILRHWVDCAAHEDTARIDIDGMRAQTFEYPPGWLGALACQAAGVLGGNDAHGAMFDAVQWAHLHQHRNIGNADVLLDIAESLGHRRGVFAGHMRSDAVRQRVQADRAEAAALGIRSIPTVIGGHGLRLQTLPLPQLRQALAPLVVATAAPFPTLQGETP